MRRAALTAAFVSSIGEAAADQSTAGVVAVVEQVFPKGKSVSEVAKIVRHQAKEPPPPEGFLRAGDSVSLEDGPKEAELVIRVLATGNRVVIGANEPDRARRSFIASSATPGVSERLAAFFKSYFLGQDLAGTGVTMSGSRGDDTAGPCFNAAGETNQPRTFDVPSLAASTNALAAGKRDLLVAWIGGAPPFAVELAKAGEAKPIVHKEAIKGGCAVRLGPMALSPAKYRVTVIDANGATMTDPALSVEPAAPAPPPELAESGLPAEARALYAATWLHGLDQGRWAFEALQQVAALDCRSPAVKEWLSSRGVVSPGCSAAATSAIARPALPARATPAPPPKTSPAPAGR